MTFASKEVRNTRILSARKWTEKAGIGGGYKAYENALAAYDLALQAAKGNDAKMLAKEKATAQLSYAREALINQDFALARELVEPLVSLNREAEVLQKRILDKELAHRISRPRISIWTCIGVLLMAVLGLLVYNFWHHEVVPDGEKSSSMGMLVDMFNRGKHFQTDINIQIEFMAVYDELIAARHTLAKYRTFPKIREYLDTGFMLLAEARTGASVAKDAAFEHIVGGLPDLLAFQAELLAADEPAERELNQRFIQRMGGLLTGLAEYQRRVNGAALGDAAS